MTDFSRGSREKEFQRLSAEYIFEKLFSGRQKKNRRFLLADEVGLGKTVIARSVLERLFKKRRKKTCVFYVCSNVKVADQNIERVSPVVCKKGGRLTLLRNMLPRKKQDRVISLTPGTSLNIKRAMGTREERKFILYLIERIYKPFRKSKLVRYLRCLRRRCTNDNWKRERKESWDDFKTHVSKAFLRKLKKKWKGCIDDFFEEAKVFNKHNTTKTKKRSGIVGSLRQGLAMAVLEDMKPALVIFDEFQRFQDIIDDMEKYPVQKALVQGTNVLLLSATPFKMYTLSSQAENHYQELLNTLAFVYGKEGKERLAKLTKWFGEREEYFKGIKKKLRENGPEALKKRDEKFYQNRLKIEKELKSVMLRTERRMFNEDFYDSASLAGDTGSDGDEDIATADELREFVFLRSHLNNLGKKPDVSPVEILDYWKSGQWLLSFMDKGYEFIRNLDKHKKRRVFFDMARQKDKNFVFNRKDVNNKRVLRNNRLKRIAELTIKKYKEKKALWIPPSYRYYTYGKGEEENRPKKYLIFSHWRFVPRLISMVLSHQAEKLMHHTEKKSKPAFQMRLTKNGGIPYNILNLFYPSLFLAETVQPLIMLKDKTKGKEIKYGELLKHAENTIKKKIERENNVEITNDTGEMKESKGDRLFELMLYLDSRNFKEININKAFLDDSIIKKMSKEKSEKGKSEINNYKKCAQAMVDLLGEPESKRKKFRISSSELRLLATIALNSPAVCVLRTISGLFYGNEFRKISHDTFVECLKTGVSTLRNYFNRSYVQKTIKSGIRRRGRKGYWRDVMEYCARDHFQEVIDEYGYLLKGSLKVSGVGEGRPGATDPEKLRTQKIEEFMEKLSDVMGIRESVTTYYTNEISKKGSKTRRKSGRIRCHFAVAFGDQDTEKRGEKVRSASVREAFNSPFWPFVLSTTSVGQEGLDFHWYCSDVVHWNLPSNPVDLEQREGRINRYNSIVVRRNIAGQHTIRKTIKELKGETKKGFCENNFWEFLFDYLTGMYAIERILRRGFSPNWMYRGPKEPEKITPHVFLHGFSKDGQKYEMMKKHLTCYRMTFGLPRQEDMVNYLLENIGDEKLIGYLLVYMLNLWPDFNKGARQRACEIARECSRDETKLKRLLMRTKLLLKEAEKEYPGIEKIYGPIIKSINEIYQKKQSIREKKHINMLKGLAYFLDPLDAYCDYYKQAGEGDRFGGFQDDVEYLDKLGLINPKVLVN